MIGCCPTAGSHAGEALMQQQAKTALAMDERLARCGFQSGHPFGIDRQGAFAREFDRRELGGRVTLLDFPQASLEDLLLFHERAYVEFVQRSSELGTGALDGGDTPRFRGVYEAAAGVVGARLEPMSWSIACRLCR